MAVAIKRIQKELFDIKHSTHNDIPENISAGPHGDNLLEWDATIIGAVGTPYEGGLFKLKIIFPNNYPFFPPVVNFTTRIFHPNIKETGEICLDILKYHWSPAYSVPQILLSIVSLLSDANPNDPLNPDAARLYKENKKKYDNTVKDYVLRFAF